MNYLNRHLRRATPQWAPIPGAGQVPNSAGGHAWEVDDWSRLRRFLILDSEGGSFYSGEWKLPRENADAVGRCIEADGPRAVARSSRSAATGAPKNDPGPSGREGAAGRARRR